MQYLYRVDLLNSVRHQETFSGNFPLKAEHRAPPFLKSLISDFELSSNQIAETVL
jgi:hypothetical protein